MKKLVSLALAVVLTFAPGVILTGCGDGWETVTSGGIRIETVDRDPNGYIVEDAAKTAALEMGGIYDENLCDYFNIQFDDSKDPVTYTVDYSAEGTTYHYVVNAENGELISFSSMG